MNLQQHEKQHLQQHEPWMLSSLSSWTCRSSMLSTSSSELSMTGKHLVWQHLQKHFLHLSNVWVNMRITGRIKNIIIHETTIDDSYLVSPAPSIRLYWEAKKVPLTKTLEAISKNRPYLVCFGFSNQQMTWVLYVAEQSRDDISARKVRTMPIKDMA